MLVEGSVVGVCFFKCCFNDALQFSHRVIKNQHFQTTHLGGWDTKKGKPPTLCTLLIMLTILHDP